MSYEALTRDQKLDVRATQRTFDGAYFRTAMNQLSFALIVLKIFSRDFVPIATLLTAYGVLVLGMGYIRKKRNERFIEHEQFETSGGIVIMLTVMTIGFHIALIVLLTRLKRA